MRIPASTLTLLTTTTTAIANPNIHTLALTDRVVDTSPLGRTAQDRIVLLHFFEGNTFAPAELVGNAFDARAGTWGLASPEFDFGPSFPDISLAGYGTGGFGHATYRAFYQTPRGGPSIQPLLSTDATPWAMQTSVPSPATPANMIPMSAFTYLDAQGLERGNFFGVSSDGTSLLEGFKIPLGGFSAWNHGPPSGNGISFKGKLSMAPGAAVVYTAPNGNPDVFAFVAGSDNHVYDAFEWGNGSIKPWQWQDLGNPGFIHIGDPIGVIHPTDGGSQRVHVFVPGEDAAGNWRLFERFADRQSDGTWYWADWKALVTPNQGKQFSMVQAVVWTTSGGFRISMFGHGLTGKVDNVFHIFWNGSQWIDQTFFQTDEHVFALTGVTAINSSDVTRISLFAEDENDEVWEMATPDGVNFTENVVPL
jgi:hypothetical protein